MRWADVRTIEMTPALEAAFEALGYQTKNSRIRTLEAKVEALGAQKSAQMDLAERAALKLSRGQPLNRPELAAYLGVSTKKLQRMEAVGRLQRCSGMGTVVLYAAREVQRLASATGKER